MRIERTAKTVIAGLMSVACLASVAACGPGSSSNKANTETEAVSTDLGDTKYELKLWDGAGLKTFDDQLIEAFQKKYPNITIKATYDPDLPAEWPAHHLRRRHPGHCPYHRHQLRCAWQPCRQS